MNNWDDIRYFLAIARARSVRGAAASLDVNMSTVSRRIAAFEQSLDVRLFERLPSGYELTPAGEAMLESAVEVEEGVFRLDRQIFGRDAQLAGDLCVTLSPAVALGFMAGELAEFSRVYPGINLDIVVSDQQYSLSRREADVAIRTTESPSPDLVGRRLFKFACAVYATADYLREHRENNNAEAVTWVGWGDDSPTAKWIKETGFPSAPIKHRVREIMVQIELVKAGMGISLLPCIHGDSDPNLRRWPPADPIPGETIWLLTHEDLRNTARVRLFMDFAANAIERYRDRLQGTAPAVASRKI